MSDSTYNTNDYTVGWVCALPSERAAAKGMLDRVHPKLSEQAPEDTNSYTLGQVHGHNVVIACLPSGNYGTTPAATVANNMLRTFKSIRFGLMVGVGGGAPSPGHDIRLGDIVVSQPSGTTGGVIQYDRGKDGLDGFERTGSLNSPPRVLLNALNELQADSLMQDSRIPNFLSELHDKYPKMKKGFGFQGESNDCLFQADYDHPIGEPGCEGCDRTRAVPREARGDTEPVIHYGNIASGNQVIKNARTRDRLAKELGVLCFEMEAAGLMQDFPCIVIRGICDYADSHKNKAWQGYAAAAAAAFAKELLSVISPARVLQDKAIPQLVSDPVAHEMLASTNETISNHATRQETRYENDKQSKCHQVFKTSRYEHFKNLNPNRVPGTCKWVLDHPQYKKWRHSTHDDLLWISADPGCGKSVLTKALVDEELGSADDHTVCYFFFKDNEDQNDLAAALCAILHQLFGRLPHLLRHAAHAFQQNGNNLKNEVDELWRIFLAAATDESAGAVFCLFDALDECQRDGRRKLIRLVSDFYARRVSASGSMLKFFTTSRPYQDIESGFNIIPPELPSIRLAGEESNADISEEINLVMRQKIQELHIDQEVQDMLQGKLLATSNRTYLWLHLVWDELEESRRTGAALMKTIDLLPSTVEDAYEHILNRIRPHKREEARTFLHIVVGARRPLTLREMDVAFQLAVDSPHATSHKELELNNDRLQSDIRDLCGLFVYISDGRIYLIHQTAKEFLVAKEGASDSHENFWRHSLRREFSNEIMTRVCVQYLSFRDIRDDLPYYDKWRKHHSWFKNDTLLEYSAENWPVHFRDMDGADDGLINFILKLYDDQTQRFETWLWIYWRATYSYKGQPRGIRPLHLAAMIGHIEVVGLLIQTHLDDIDVPDGNSRTALIWAAKQGHYQIVKLLLESRADINAQGSWDGNALQAASFSGYIDIVKLLLKNGADVNTQGGGHGTALQAASSKGHIKTVQLLLTNGADVNVQGGEYGNALCAASQSGYIEIVKLLLEEGADVKAPAGARCNALQDASGGGHIEIVRLLFEKGADATAEGSEFSTALQDASIGGYIEVVKLLVENGADINAPPGEDGTAMQNALKIGHDEIVNLLMANGLDIDATDDEEYGGTPLIWAAINGHNKAIEMLLTKGAKVNVKDNLGRTPLSHAAEDGYSEAVKLLLANGAGVNTRDNQFGQTPLSWAAMNGHDEVVELLCGIGHVDINLPDNFDRPPLSWAATYGHIAVVKLLLRTGRVDSSSVDAHGRTPLSWATRKGRGAVVELLLGVDSFAVSSVHATLLLAAARGQETVVNMLISRGDVDLAAEDERGISALQLAVFNNHTGVEELLVASGAPVVSDFFGLQSLFGEDITY